MFLLSMALDISLQINNISLSGALSLSKGEVEVVIFANDLSFDFTSFRSGR